MCMNRRLALTVAGATAVVVTAASGAMAANLSILGSEPTEAAGRLTAANVAELSVPADPVPSAAESPTVVDGTTLVPVEPVPAVPPRAGRPLGSSGTGSTSSASDGPDASSPSMAPTVPDPRTGSSDDGGYSEDEDGYDEDDEDDDEDDDEYEDDD